MKSDLFRLTRIANKLDRNGHKDLANKLDGIIYSLAHNDAALMTDEEVQDRSENIILELAQKFTNAGYKLTAQQLLGIFEQVGANPAAIAQEIDKLQQ